MRRLLNLFDAIGEWIGWLVALAILMMIGIIILEIVARHAFDPSTDLIYGTKGWLQAGLLFVGGAFALQRGFFVGSSNRLSPRTQAWIDVALSTALFALIAGAVIWKVPDLAMGSPSSLGAEQGPVWPAGVVVAVAVVLLGLAWISRVGRQLILLGRPDAAE